MTSAAPPVVGVTTYRERAAWGSWDRDAVVLASAYVERVSAAGSWPILLPPVADADAGSAGADAGSADAMSAGAESAEGSTGVGSAGQIPGSELVARLDALVVVGGSDVDPARYGARSHPRTAGVDRRRDAHELALLEAALQAELPVLAICRGMQLLNVLLGGRLEQHLPEVVGSDDHQPARGCFSEVTVTTVPGTLTAGILGSTAAVRCSHHQAVSDLGEGLVVSARAGDGTVEALELPDRPFVQAVQWHPEEDDDLRLFAALTAAARRRARSVPCR